MQEEQDFTKIQQSQEEKTGTVKKLLSNKKTLYAFIIILSVLIALFLALYFAKKDDKTESSSYIFNDYITATEKRLSETLSKVQGAGAVSVMITVESGMETVIAMKSLTTETDGKKTVEETPVLVNGKTVTLKELYPKISGVLVVAEGAKNISVMNKLLQATSSFLGISIKNIEILSA